MTCMEEIQESEEKKLLEIDSSQSNTFKNKVKILQGKNASYCKPK